MKRRGDADIMQHADGELRDDARREVDDLLGRNDEARAKRAAIDELGDLVRGHIELATDDVAPEKFDHMWRSIDGAIDAHTSVSEIAHASWLRRATRWLEQRRGYFLTAAVSAGVVAAVALGLRTSGQDGAVPAAASAAEAFRPTEIESLETPGGTSNVFHVRDEEGTTTVIWVTRDDTVEP